MGDYELAVYERLLFAFNPAKLGQLDPSNASTSAFLCTCVPLFQEILEW